jgi:hypothetical protein
MDAVRRLARRGLFAFADCSQDGEVLVTVERLDDGYWRVSCGECGGAVKGSVRFLDRHAAKRLGWHIVADESV